MTLTGDPAAIGQPFTSVSRVETRLTIVTDVSQRSVSSITASMTAESARTASSAPRWVSSAASALPITRNVVSAPAGSRRRRNP